MTEDQLKNHFQEIEDKIEFRMQIKTSILELVNLMCLKNTGIKVG